MSVPAVDPLGRPRFLTAGATGFGEGVDFRLCSISISLFAVEGGGSDQERANGQEISAVSAISYSQALL